ncbi:MAG: peptide chain release factor N(5)-glutamine methyltransferase [Acidobacteriaceae bacterium]
MTVTEARKLGASVLASGQGPQDRGLADATLLLMHALQCTRAEVLAHPERALLAEEEQHYRRLLTERASGRPIQYITGQQEFWGLPFFVTPDVLVPRPETEHLVEAAIGRLQAHSAPRIVDVGTGSGAIAVALAYALPQAQITATDISAAALAIAQQNAAQNKVAARIRWMQGDLLADLLNEKFDAVVSNPPYVAEAERPTLASEVRDHEPPTALFAGPTGLEIYERLIPQANRVLDPRGWLLLEIGHAQQPAIETLLAGWQQVAFINDLQGIARVACAQRP